MANRIRVSTEVLNAGVAGFEAQAAKVKSMNCSQGLIIWKRILKDI